VLFLSRYEPVQRTGKSDDWLTIFFARINAKWGPPIKNQNMRTGKYSFTKKALLDALPATQPTASKH